MLPPDLVVLETVAVNGGPTQMERGTVDTLSATAVDEDGDTVDVPVVWRSSNESVARFTRGGVLIALDTGTTEIRATSLGVQSAPVPYLVVWQGAAYIDSAAWSAPNARGPGVALTDSVRVRVINVDSLPVDSVRVAFTVIEGGGSVSPDTARTNQFGIAATRWTLGPVAGRNRLRAQVLRENGSIDTLVIDNDVTFTINSYNALLPEAGNDQTGQILSALPTAPSVKLVDSLGNPRSGVPVTFTVFSNGRVTSPIVSTSANGVASPGTWTLGDIPGQQILEARVEDAKVALTAFATGTPVLYTPNFISAGGFTTCALENGGIVKCWGAAAQNGTGDTLNSPTPKQVKGTQTFASVTVGQSHTCALTSSSEAWCWGLNAFVDSTGVRRDTVPPTRVPTNLTWSMISTGPAHTCGLDLLGTAYCWGFNTIVSGQDFTGQLGDGTNTTRFKPTAVSGGFVFSRVTTGGNHTCGLTNGLALCWGQNQSGQLGDGTTTTRTNPTNVSGARVYETIGAGSGFTCALTPQPEGKVYCWGNVTGVPRVVPTELANAPAFTSLSVGSGHACGLTSDATAYCWGANAFGQLGDSSFTNRSSPVKVAGGMRFTQISAGFTHTCGITTEGAAACWGRNLAGELGDSTVTQRNRPRHVVLGVTP